MEHLGVYALYVLLFVLAITTAGRTLRKLGHTLMKELNRTCDVRYVSCFGGVICNSYIINVIPRDRRRLITLLDSINNVIS
jgi:hydrogenase maturation factor HypF (carbamoyltransferase family)